MILYGVILLIISFCNAAEVLFYATDLQMRTQKEYPINKQFLVHVLVKKVAGTLDIQVPDLMRFGGRRTGVQINTINGVSSVKHSYSISFDRKGVYSLGKALVSAGGNQYFSQPLEVIVTDTVDEKSLDNSQSINNKQRQYHSSFAQLIVPNRNPFVGQEIDCFLCLYYDVDIDSIRLYDFKFPDSFSYRMSFFGQFEESIEIINGNTYRCYKFPCTLVPLKEGEITIPPFIIEYEYNDAKKNPQSIWDHFSNFFEKKRYQISVLKQTILARDVPFYDGQKVQAVGNFTSFKASVNPVIINEKEASTLSLELSGRGNFDDITSPDLLIQSDSVVTYKSNNFVTDDGNQKKKIFEYVLQPEAVGTIEIPSQQIITFNPNTEQHVLLKTDSQVVIVKQLGHEKIVLNTDLEEQDANSVIHKKQSKDFVEQFKIPGQDFVSMSRIISPSFVIFTVIIVLLIMIFLLVFRLYKQLLFFRKNFYFFTAYRIALKNILKARMNNDPVKLYPIFIELIKSRKCLVAVDFEYSFLQNIGDASLINFDTNEWHEFCLLITGFYFKGTKINDLDADQLDLVFNNALWWLDELQKKGL